LLFSNAGCSITIGTKTIFDICRNPGIKCLVAGEIGANGEPICEFLGKSPPCARAIGVAQVASLVVIANRSPQVRCNAVANINPMGTQRPAVINAVELLRSRASWDYGIGIEVSGVGHRF
jgi:hypothetical protein